VSRGLRRKGGGGSYNRHRSSRVDERVRNFGYVMFDLSMRAVGSGDWGQADAVHRMVRSRSRRART